MVRTVQGEFLKNKRDRSIQHFSGQMDSVTEPEKKRGQFAMPLCEGRDGKEQVALYRFDQTAEYVRSKSRAAERDASR